MSVAPGTTLGVFKVTSSLGAGGMGEVYRATDTRLKREVAIKLLPASFADDPLRLSRLQREAELLASVNHPNIAAIYGIEDTAAGKALVMELVEGVDLRDRISRGTPSIDEAMPIARQLASAIAAAHARGVVHRDLKPANIRLRRDGTVKVLDFGLAKGIASEDSNDNRQTVTATEVGTIQGTPGYMSPEQARGELAGVQSDIWAFGVVFYELLAGRAPFAAPSTVEALAKVLTADPDFNLLPPGVPPRIRLLLQRCLRKDPQRRLHHIGDALIELDEAGATAEPLPAPPVARKAVSPLGAGGIALAIIAAAVAGWLVHGNPAPRPAVVRAEVYVPYSLNSYTFGVRRLAMSRDGTHIAVATPSALRIRRIDHPDFIALDAEAVNPFFSPDAKSVAYFDSGIGLYKIPTAGGASVMLAPTSDRTLGGDWRADGTIVFATTSGLFLIRDDGSQLRTLAKPDAAHGQRSFAWPQFLGDSNLVQFTILPEGAATGAQIALIDITSSKIDVVTNGDSARYLPGGRLVYAFGQQLKTIAFDPKRPQDHGSESAIDGVSVEMAQDNGAADFAVSDSGTLLFLPARNSAAAPTQLSWVSRNGVEEPIDMPAGQYLYPRVSPDATRIALDVLGAANRDIWLYDLQRHSLSQLSFGPTEDMLPLWTRDGQRVVWASDRSGNFDIYSRAADGATPERVDFASPAVELPNSFSLDGSLLFIFQDFRDIGVLKGPPYQRIEPVLHAAPAIELLAELSPDGRWLAYESNETGAAEILVRPYPDVEAGRLKVSRAGGRYPLWNPAGNGELFYMTNDGQMMAAEVATSPTLAVRSEKKLFTTQAASRGISARLYDYSAKTGKFLTARRLQQGASNDTRLSMILNWSPDANNR